MLIHPLLLCCTVIKFGCTCSYNVHVNMKPLDRVLVVSASAGDRLNSFRKQ